VQASPNAAVAPKSVVGRVGFGVTHCRPVLTGRMVASAAAIIGRCYNVGEAPVPCASPPLQRQADWMPPTS